MILTNCNCGEKVECGCGTLTFDSYVSPAVSVLDIGNLVSSNGCVFDEYVIDWYKDGERYQVDGNNLVSGKGYDPEITAFHPFQGEGAIIVEPGTYVPVLRYVVIDGDVIFPEPKPCQKWCEMIVDLPTITVTAIYCGLVGTGANAAYANYDYSMRYVSGTDWTQAGRIFQFDLNETTLFFAYYYIPQSVADRLTIWHSSDLVNPIVDYIAGNNLSGTNYDLTPHEIDMANTRQIFELPAYTTGAYLKIRIIPAVKETTQNTNWRLDMKCHDDTYDFCDEFLIYNTACQQFDIDTLSFTFDTSTCLFNLLMEYALPPVVAPSSVTEPGLNKYAGISVGTFGTFSQPSTYVYGAGRAYQTTGSTQSDSVTGYSVKASSKGLITVDKSLNVFTFTCADADDYADLKYGYTEVIKLSNYTGFINDNTKLEYYRAFLVTFYYSGSGGCGDDETLKTLYFHPNSVFTWDDTNKILTIESASVTNGYATSTDPCNEVHSSLTAFVNLINNLISESDYTKTTYCKIKYPFGRFYRYNISLGVTTFPLIRYVSMPLKYTVPCPTPGWTKFGGNAAWFFFNYHYQVTITAARDINGNWIDDPLENFYVTCGIDKSGVLKTTAKKIYEMSGGVVTTKVSWTDMDD